MGPTVALLIVVEVDSLVIIIDLTPREACASTLVG